MVSKIRVISKYIIYILLIFGGVSHGEEVPYTLEDRDRLIRVEATLREFKDAVDKRFEGIDKRFEEINKRFEEIFTFLWILSGIFTTITITTIGFALWDRRTMIRPFEAKTKEIIDRIELESGRIEKLILSLRELSKSNSEVAEVLRKFSLL